MASIAVEVLICFEYEFSEIEIGTSILANIMMRAAVEQHLHLPGFLLRHGSTNSTVNSYSSTKNSNVSSMSAPILLPRSTNFGKWTPKTLK
jgi:hypothetical protein